MSDCRPQRPGLCCDWVCILGLRVWYSVGKLLRMTSGSTGVQGISNESELQHKGQCFQERSRPPPSMQLTRGTPLPTKTQPPQTPRRSNNKLPALKSPVGRPLPDGTERPPITGRRPALARPVQRRYDSEQELTLPPDGPSSAKTPARGPANPGLTPRSPGPHPASTHVPSRWALGSYHRRGSSYGKQTAPP